jgi:hypothetical protein
MKEGEPCRPPLILLLAAFLSNYRPQRFQQLGREGSWFRQCCT